MSDTFVVAARLRLKKKSVTAWLRGPLAQSNDIDGWNELVPDRTLGNVDSPPKSVRHLFASMADDVATNEVGGLVAAWSGSARSFLFYHVMIGWQPDTVAASLCALAAASEHWTTKKPATALCFAETSGRLRPDAALGTMSIGTNGASAASGVDLDALVADLKPAEALWVGALDTGLVDSLHDPDVLQPAIRQLGKSPLLAKRKREVPQFDDADAWLAAVAAINFEHKANPQYVGHYGSFGQFERDVMKWADQAAKFGADVVPKLLHVIDTAPWYASVTAVWACNVIARSTGDPSHYVAALQRFARGPDSHQGWARGELTDDDIQAGKDHAAALVGSEYEGWTWLRFVREALKTTS